VEEAARLLARAKRPLVIVSGSGRDPAAVPALVALAEAGGIGVVEVDPTHVNFPQSHPLHVGFTQPSGTDPAVAEADVVLVIDADVPWYPSLAPPAADAAVIHLAVDPAFSRYPMRSFACDVPIAAHPAAALPLLAESVRRLADRAAVDARRAHYEGLHRERRARWAADVEAQRAWPRPGFAFVTACLQEILDDSTIVVNEYPVDRRYLAFDRPKSFYGQPHSSGLGWGLPTALGLKLAAPEKTVIATLGDGSYLFNEPAACHMASRQHGLPVLTVIFNNQQWEAVKQSALGVHPDGWAKQTGRYPLSDLAPAPRYEEIVRAFDGHAERVEQPGDVVAALKRAMAAVREGRQAVVNVVAGRARD
jgi:acetolactate synthase-1/2/3 large subunit